MLPLYNKKFNVNGKKFRFQNAKALVLLLLIVSIITVFIILMNLPPEIRNAIKNQKIHNVFVPELELNLNHDELHKHPKPSINEEFILYENKDSENQDNSVIGNTSPSINEEYILYDNEDSESQENSIDDIEIRRETIKNMTLFAWKNYEKYAWGENELRPLTKIGHSSGIFGSIPTRLGATIVDGLDTIYLMGFMDEYKRGKEWIEKFFNIDVNSLVSVFEINIRFIGGFLSMYTLTKDKMFLDKAEYVASKLLPVFNTETGIPFGLINPMTNFVTNHPWAAGSCSILAEIGTLSLEFQYLSDLTGNKTYAKKIKKINKFLRKVNKANELYQNYLNPNTGEWCMNHVSMGGLGDSFYEYLLKLWIYNNKEDKDLLEMYLASIKAIEKKLVSKSSNNLTFLGEYKSDRLEKKMDHLSCFSAGLFALTSISIPTLNQEEKNNYMNLAKSIVDTCHESYIRSPTHIGPEAFHFETIDNEAKSIKAQEKYYILRPEVIESYFYMWRITKEKKYRDWAWDAAQAIEKHCRTENGYSGIRDVYDINSSKDDVQQSFFLAETLKYLFLIFSDDDVLPLDKYVLNTEAHPFLIKL